MPLDCDASILARLRVLCAEENLLMVGSNSLFEVLVVGGKEKTLRNRVGRGGKTC